MAFNAKPPRLATSAAREIDHFGKLIVPTNSLKSFNAQDLAASLVAERYHLPPTLARVVVELAQLGGRLA